MNFAVAFIPSMLAFYTFFSVSLKHKKGKKEGKFNVLSVVFFCFCFVFSNFSNRTGETVIQNWVASCLISLCSFSL